jgi:elongation factor Ts
MTPAHRVIETYVHNARIGVLIEFGLATSFTARVPEFAQLAKDLALHVAGAKPTSVDELLTQAFVKDSSLTVGQFLSNASKLLGEHITVIRFSRWDTEEPLHSSPTPPTEPAAAGLLRRIR